MGCILGEMLLGVPIFQGTSSMHQLDLIAQLIGPPTPGEISVRTSYCAQACVPPARCVVFLDIYKK